MAPQIQKRYVRNYAHVKLYKKVLKTDVVLYHYVIENEHSLILILHAQCLYRAMAGSTSGVIYPGGALIT